MFVWLYVWVANSDNFSGVLRCRYSFTGVDFGLSQMLMIVSSIIGVVFVDALIISVFSEKYVCGMRSVVLREIISIGGSLWV